MSGGSEEGEILWTSEKVEKIGNREDLPLNKPLPEDPVFFPSHAGDKKQHHIVDGKIVTIGNRNRIYLDIKNLNVSLECMAIGGKKIVEFNLKLGSFHSSEDLATNKAFGGYSGGFDFKDQEAICKVEPFHNFYFDPEAQDLQEEIKRGKPYHFKVTRQNVKGKKEVVIRQYIDYGNNQWKKVNEFRYKKNNWNVLGGIEGLEEKKRKKAKEDLKKAKTKEDIDEILDGPYMSDGGRLWLRCNAEGDRNNQLGQLTLWNIIVRKLDELDD